MMLRRTFFAVFFFIFCVTLNYATEGARGAEAKKEHTLCGGQETQMVIYKGRLKELKEQVVIDSFRSPALIEVEGKVAVVAEAHYKEKDKKFVGSVLATVRDDGKLKQISAVLQDGDEHPFLLSPTVVVDKDGGEDDITVYFGAYCQDGQPLKRTCSSSDFLWEPRMLTGNFVPSRQDEKYIEWHDDTETKEHDFKPKRALELIKDMGIEEFIGSGGAGIRMEDDKYVFPMHALYTNGSTVSLIITSSDAVYEWEFSDGRSDINCTNPAVLEFNEGELLMITSCDTGHYNVYKSKNAGENWAAVETLSGVWGTNKQRNGPGFRGGFVKAKIDKTDVVFFTQPVQESNIYTLHLWMTDMRHIYDVGRISADNENVFASSLLYKNPEDYEGRVNKKNVKFYCAYEVKNNGEKDDVVVVDLKNKLEKIKDVVKTWEKVDEKVVKRFCMSQQRTGDTSATECKDSITEGLVGYLSLESLKDNKRWDDEYLCANTTASPNARDAVSGFHSTAGNEFKWPANSDEQNQLYHFANKAFTLVATVVISKKPNEKVPLLGVVFKNPREKRYELSYSKDNQWSVTNGNDQKLRNNIDWTTDKQYQVVLSRKDAKLHVYVDGKPFQEEGDTDDIFDLTNEGSFSHFYIGAYDTENSKDVTVTNILLYNRHLKQNEITQNIKRETISTTVTKEEKLGKQGKKILQATSQSLSENVKREVKDKESQKQQLQKEANGDLNFATGKGHKSHREIKKEVPFMVSSGRQVVVGGTEKTDGLITPADATNHDISLKNKESIESEGEIQGGPVKEETENGKRQGITQQEHAVTKNDGMKEEKSASTATVPGDVRENSPAADNTSLREKTDAQNHNKTLKKLLQPKSGDGAVRSCVSLLVLLPSLCLWCFLTALHCCQAIAV